MFTKSVESITECKKSDIPELVEIAKSTYAETYPGFFTSERLAEIFTAEKFENDLENPSCRIFVAQRGVQLVGYAKVIFDAQMILDKIYVAEKMKGTGCGIRLIQACFQLALSKNIHQSKVFVFDTNTKVKGFYEKFGFRENGEKEPYYNNGKLAGYDNVMLCDDIRKYLASTMRPKL
ncbi:MAG: GNAT family N-acetyltransferase [Gammaproteobacteria bacterium]|nr:GNAT family N-acetyltransferase [Gammaproteobacteria bacterium]